MKSIPFLLHFATILQDIPAHVQNQVRMRYIPSTSSGGGHKVLAFRFIRIYILLISILSVLLLAPLLFSAFQSGYGYQFDTDELHHANLVYLIANGFIPYRDIYNSFYTPLFEWTLLPVFTFFGFSFKTIMFTRFVMILMYGIRLLSLYTLIRNLWNRRTALLFIPLLILDPFAVLSSFQIRTDNFMLMLYSVGLAIAAVGVKRPASHMLEFAAFFLGLSALSFPKIIPSVGIIVLFLMWFRYSQKGFRGIVKTITATAFPTLLFLMYGLFTGSLYEMWMQLVVDAKAAYSVFRAPLPFGAIFYPNNLWIYGTMGKPVTWMYIWILPLLGAGGLFSQLTLLLQKKTIVHTDVFKLLLGLTLILNFISLFALPVVFLQHYLLINWLYALFAGALIDDTLRAIESRKTAYVVVITILFLVYAHMVNMSRTYNYARSTIRGQETIEAYEKRFTQIGQSESVFPNFLFRPPVYPVPFGYYIGNVPESIMNRLPDIPTMLDDKKVQKLLFDEYTFSLMPTHVQAYVTEHYSRVPGDPELMVRK